MSDTVILQQKTPFKRCQVPSFCNKRRPLRDVRYRHSATKGAPLEMLDTVIRQQMGLFGEVMSCSHIFVKIRYTCIEHGTRKIKILNCVLLLPHTISIGWFILRLFADNKNTACKVCTQTSYPHAQCPNKNTQQLNGSSTDEKHVLTWLLWKQTMLLLQEHGSYS